MSLLVNADGSLKTYAVVNNRARTVVAAFNTIQKADKGLKELQKDGADDLTLHNITHPKCPDWLQEIIRSRKAEIFDAEAAALRRKATDLVAQAEEVERRASEWREFSECASVPSGPGL
jgi:hypothetical protein